MTPSEMTPDLLRKRAEEIVREVEVARLGETAYLTVEDLKNRIYQALLSVRIEALRESPDVKALLCFEEGIKQGREEAIKEIQQQAEVIRIAREASALGKWLSEKALADQIDMVDLQEIHRRFTNALNKMNQVEGKK